MKKIFLAFAAIVALCLIVWAMAWLLAIVTGAVLFTQTINVVAELLHMPGCVKTMVFWTLLAPVSLLMGRLFAPFGKMRVRAFLCLIAVLGVYWAGSSRLKAQQFFDSSGRPCKWAEIADGHITYFDQPGTNEVTGRIRIQVTPSLYQKLHSNQGTLVSPQRADPEKADWFSPVNRDALLYYVRGDRYAGGWEFYTGVPEMFHPRTGEPLQPVSASVRETWETDFNARQEAAKKTALAAAASEVERKAQVQAEALQRMADAQQRDSVRLAEAQRQLDSERAQLKKAALTAEIAKAHAEEQQRAALQEQAAAGSRRVAEEPVTSTTTIVYSMPQTYATPVMTYYYSAPVRYYQVVRPVRYGYPVVWSTYQYSAGNRRGGRQGR